MNKELQRKEICISHKMLLMELPPVYLPLPYLSVYLPLSMELPLLYISRVPSCVSPALKSVFNTTFLWFPELSFGVFFLNLENLKSI